jgi:pimeloyl-ACP methyl ester carboxylesterase
MQVEQRGDGPIDLLVITPIGAEWMAAALPIALDTMFTLHIAELAGTGRSEGDPARASASGVVAAVAEAAAALASEHLVLFGHSMNGTLALLASVDAPCVGVIAVTPAPALPLDPVKNAAYWEAKAEPERRQRAAAIVAAHNAADSGSEKARLVQEYGHLRQWRDLDYDSSTLDAFERDPGMHWVNAIFESAKAVDWPASFARIACPVFIALGEYDFLAPMTLWTPDLLPPHTTVEVFNRSGHSPYVEQPTEFVEAVERWVANLGISA